MFSAMFNVCLSFGYTVLMIERYFPFDHHFLRLSPINRYWSFGCLCSRWDIHVTFFNSSQLFQSWCGPDFGMTSDLGSCWEVSEIVLDPSSDQHLDTQEQGHLGWSTMQGCWPRLPASPLGIWHDHKAHQNLDATPGNRQGGGNQNRLSESFHPLAKWRSYRRNGVLCGNLKWCFLHTEFVKWTFSPLYILYLPTEKSTCQRCGTWSTGMQPPEVMTSGKWFIVSLPQSPHLWWGLYCSLFNAEVKHCVFPSTLVFSVYLFISLTPGIKQGESSYRDLKKKQRAGGRYQPEDY